MSAFFRLSPNVYWYNWDMSYTHGTCNHPNQNIHLESGSQDKDIRQSTCKLFLHQKARGILGRGPSCSSSIPAIAVTQISDQEAGYPWGLLLGLHRFLVTLSGLSDLQMVARIVGFTTLRGYCKAAHARNMPAKREMKWCMNWMMETGCQVGKWPSQRPNANQGLPHTGFRY